MSDGENPFGHDKFSDIKSLPCYDQLIDRMRRDWPVPQIVGWLQEDLHLMKHLKPDSLRTKLFEFRKTVPGLDTSITPATSPELVLQRASDVDFGLNELDELQALYKIQRRRIDRGLAAEEREMDKKPVQNLNSSVDKAIRDARETLNSRAILKIKLGIGLGPEKPKSSASFAHTVEEEVKAAEELAAETTSRVAQRVLGDAASRGRVLGVIRALQSLGRHGDVIDSAAVADIIDKKAE